jgi:hypothetical protein
VAATLTVIADDLAGLMSAAHTLRVPVQDPALGRTEALQTLRKAKGLIVTALGEALDAARALGLYPREAPLWRELPMEIPRTGNEGLLRGIAKRLDEVVGRLDALDHEKAVPTAFPQQTGLLNFYIGAMRVEVDLARLHLTVDAEMIDFGALARAVEVMTELTGDFVATVRAWIGRVSDAVTHIADGVRRRVRRLAAGTSTAVKWIERKAEKLKRFAETAALVNVEVANCPGAVEIVSSLKALGFQPELSEDPDYVKETYEDSHAIWIGSLVPPRAALMAIKRSLQSWPFLCYMHLSADTEGPDYIHKEIFIGGSTTTAREDGLKKWTRAEIDAIPNDIGMTDFHRLIRSRYAQTEIDRGSCFISYSGKDQAFAERLHADLQNKGVRCWFAPRDLPIGAKTWDAIDEAIRFTDKLLLILSKASIASEWVEDEVNKAYAEERSRKEVVLFPIRIDNAVISTGEPWTVKLRDQRNIGDFRKWKKPIEYQKSLDRLLRDLKASERK